jgi:ribosomal protein L11 methyltransferase
MIRLAVRVSRAQAELVLAELLELTPCGVEEVDLGPGGVEYAVYGAPGELPGLPDVQALAGDALVEISTSEVADDWQERWRTFHRPVLVPAPAGGAVPALYVRPPWEPAHARAGGDVAEVVIDPGQAFGTGGHDTTRLCLELLLELAAHDPGRGAVLDVGTGSGVLAIAAALLGYSPVLGVDNEAESIAAAADNAAANGVSPGLERLDLRREELPAIYPGTIVLANLLRPLLLELPRALPARPAHLIAGGLLAEEAGPVSETLCEELALGECEHLSAGGWAALWLARPSEDAQRASGSSVEARTIER